MVRETCEGSHLGNNPDVLTETRWESLQRVLGISEAVEAAVVR